jgi:hypothetical protein
MRKLANEANAISDHPIPPNEANAGVHRGPGHEVAALRNEASAGLDGESGNVGN